MWKKNHKTKKLHIHYIWDYISENSQSRWDSMVTDLVIWNDMVLFPSQIFNNWYPCGNYFISPSMKI